MTGRPNWDEYFMGIADAATKRSTCLHRQVAAIIVKERQIVSVGYNGNLPRQSHCLDIGCAREDVPSGQRMELCRGVHAEQNAVAMAARFGNAVNGGYLYTTHFPCSSCSKLIVRAGIVEVVYSVDYPDPLAKKLLNDSGVVVRRA